MVIPSHDGRHVIQLHVRLTALTFGLTPSALREVIDRGLITSHRGMIVRRLIEGEASYMEHLRTAISVLSSRKVGKAV